MMYKKNSYNRAIAVVIVLIFLVSTLNLNIFAANEENKTKKEPQILKEVVEKRTEDTKHFLLDDGTFEAVLYGQPVHYKDKDQWRTIDNRMYATRDDNNEDVLRNTQNDFTIDISKNLNDKELVKIKKGNYEISWGLEKANIKNKENKIGDLEDVEAKYKSHDIKNKEFKKKFGRLKKNDQVKVIQGISSEVNFNNILPNVDLQYITDSNSVKENIIIKKKIESPEFYFNINVKNLTAEILEDKTIIFYDSKDKDKIVYKIDVPYMTSMKTEVVGEVEIKLEKNGSGYRLGLIPDNEWLSKADYPVVIDPPIVTDASDPNKIEDVRIFSGYSPYREDNTINPVAMGYGASTNKNRTLIKFNNLPSFTNAYEITGAYYYMSFYAADSRLTPVGIHRVKSSWNVTSVTYNNQPGFDTAIDTENVTGAAGTQFNWDVTSVVKGWYSGTYPNYGFCLKNVSEAAASAFNRYHSSESTVDGKRPYLSIHYKYKDNIKQYLGRVEAESMIDNNGVAIAKSSDSSTGHYVNGISSASEYLTMNVNSRKSGIYDVEIAFKSSSSQNIVEVITNDGESDQYKTNVKLPDPSSNWKTIKAKLKLRKGLNKLKVKAYKGFGWSIDYVEFTHNLPDVIEAENYYKSSGVSAYDYDDLLLRVVDSISVGDSFEYKVKVENAGLYNMDFIVSSPYDNTGKFDLKDQKGNIITTVVVPKTGAYKNFTTVSKEVYLTKDITNLKVDVTGAGWDIDKFEAHHIGPRKLEAEEYYDMYGTADYIDTSGDQYIGSINEGDFASYKIIVRKGGLYNLNLRVASPANNGIIRVENGNGKVLERFNIPCTDGYQKYKEINKIVELETGSNIIKLCAEYRSFDIESLVVSHTIPKEIEAKELSDTNTAVVDTNGVVILKESEYVDYNIFAENKGEYVVKIKTGNTVTPMELNIEDSENKVIGMINIPGAVSQEEISEKVNISEGFTRLRIFSKKGNGTIKMISILDEEKVVENPEELTEEVVDVKSMITQREEYASTELDGDIYAISGKDLYYEGLMNKAEVYNPFNNNWKSIKNIPTAVQGAVCEGFDGNVYVIGGTNTETISKVQVYNVENKTWSAKTDMPTKRTKMGSVLLNGKIYVAAGYDGSKYLNTLEVYDIASDTWESKANVPSEIVGAELEVLNGKIYLVGGRTKDDEAVDSMYEYNIESNLWIQKSSMNKGRWGHSVSVKNDKLYVIGGYNSRILKDVEIYNPETEQWTLNSGLNNARFNMESNLLGNQIFVTGGHNFMLGGTLAINEVLAESEYNGNDTAISSIDVITITHETDYSQTNAPVYFQAYLNDGSSIYSGDKGSRIDSSDSEFELNKSDRFHITGNSACTLGQLKSFKLTLAENDGWKIKGVIVIVNEEKVVYSNMDVNTLLDTDNPACLNYLERSFDKYINVAENGSQISSSSNISVITTTSNSPYSESADPVYIKLSENSSEYQLKNTLTGNFANGKTDNFLDITGDTQISQFDKLQLRLDGTDDWKIRSLIVLMNDDVVYYGEDINRGIGDDGGEIWTDESITSGTFIGGEIDDNDEAVNSIEVTTLTSGDDNSDSDSDVYLQGYLNDGSPIYSDQGAFLGTPADDLEKNQSDRFVLTGNKSCKIGELKSFKLTITGNDGWRIKGLIVTVNNKRVVYSDLNINTWIDMDSPPNKPYIERDFDVFIDSEENRNSISSCSDVNVFTTTPVGTYMGTVDPVFITLSESSGEFELKNATTGDFAPDTTDNFLDVTGDTAISKFDKLALRVNGVDDWKVQSLIIIMNNKVVYFKGDINQGIGDDGVDVWTDESI